MKILYVMLLLMPFGASAQNDIAEARNMKTGKAVTVRGHVTATFGTVSFIQDHSGAIAVYGAATNINDSITVSGKLSKFNSLLEVVADSIKILASNLNPVIPRVVNRISEHEAKLVRIENVHPGAKGLFFYPEHSGPLVKTNDTLQYWIDENTDIPGYKIPETTSITGIVGRYGNQFQLMPRSHTDIENATIEQPQINNNFKVLNWNLEFFGASKYGPPDDKLQLANVAKVLNSSHADLMALQEISSDDSFLDLIHLVPGYNGRCSNRYSYSFDPSGDFPPQKLCYIYNTATVNVIREKILFREIFDEDPSDMFSGGRLPYLLEVETSGRRLTFVNVHEKSGSEVSDAARRLSDSKLLKDTLDNYEDVILLGDFNDELNTAAYENFISDHNYSCLTKGLSEQGWHSTLSYDDMIDHQVISSSLDRYLLNTKVFNVFSLIPLYGKTTSDHLPVISEFNFNESITGIVDDESDVFPNPVVNELWFTPSPASIVLMNALGAVLYENENAHPPISLNGYASGLYLLIVNDHAFRIVKD